MKVIHAAGAVVYKDERFASYLMDDFGNLVLIKDHLKELNANFLMSAFVFNKGDIGN